jgi:hypothetical protein
MAIHEDDAYVRINWESEIEESLALPSWTSPDLTAKVVSSVRFGRPMPPGAMCGYWTPIRSFTRTLKSIMATLGGPIPKLSSAEVIKFCLLVSISEQSAQDPATTVELKPFELLKLDGPSPGTCMIYVRALQSAIRNRTLTSTGAPVHTRPAAGKGGKKGGGK